MGKVHQRTQCQVGSDCGLDSRVTMTTLDTATTLNTQAT